MANPLTRKQIAALVGRSPQYVGSYIKRRHLVEENKKIDTDHPINKAWIAKHTTRSAVENGKVLVEKTVKKARVKAYNESQGMTLDDSQLLASALEVKTIDQLKKQKEIKRLEADTQLKELELKKKKARVLPLDFVLDWSERNLKGVFAGNINFANTLIEQICNELGADIDVKLKYKKKFKEGLTEVTLQGIKDQEPEALNFAKEYSLQTKW